MKPDTSIATDTPCWLKKGKNLCILLDSVFPTQLFVWQMYREKGRREDPGISDPGKHRQPGRGRGSSDVCGSQGLRGVAAKVCTEGFPKIHLDPGEKRRVSLSCDLQDMAYYNEKENAFCYRGYPISDLCGDKQQRYRPDKNRSMTWIYDRKPGVLIGKPGGRMRRSYENSDLAIKNQKSVDFFKNFWYNSIC